MEEGVKLIKLSIRFKDIASRLSGISIPVFGVSWTPPESERKIIRDLLVFLEDRRALYNPFVHEIEAEVTQSVLDIRKALTAAIQRLPEKCPATPRLRAIRAACREYLNSTHPPHRLFLGFLEELCRLRSLFGVNIAYLAVEYGIDIEGELASIVPPEFIRDEGEDLDEKDHEQALAADG